MKIWTIDYETYFSDDYTLKKMTTEAYIRDPRFEALMLGVRTPEGVTHWVEQDAIAKYLSTIDWSDAAVLCHHAHFDGLILSHHYGVRPAAWLDTLSMARLQLGNHVSASLASLTKHYNLPDKSVPYERFKGRRWAEISFDLREELGAGCVHDVELTWDIFKRLLEGFPREELQIIDFTVRMFTEPTLAGDAALFDRVQVQEWTQQDDALAEMGVTKKDIGSNEKFIALLRAEGVDVEYKPGKNGPIPALSKTDDFMKELAEDANERVRNLANCRLDVRSSIAETRAGRLAGMSRRGALPIYLSYCGAHTTRWSGGDSVNFQNFPRKGNIRRGVKAPPGMKLAVADYSQIEARILNHVAGQEDICEAFASGRDLYSEGASRFYGRPINKKDNPTERHLGKVIELGCFGPDTFILTNNGPKRITEVAIEDQLWDGVEWVSHQGVVTRGERSVMTVAGLEVTPDHLVLCGNTWMRASDLLKGDTLSRALATFSESLSSPAIKSRHGVVWPAYLSAVAAERPSTRLTRTTCFSEKLPDAIHALRSSQDIGKSVIAAMQTFARMTPTGSDCLIEYRLSLRALTPNEGTETTEGVVYFAMTYGEKIVEHSWRISLASLAGIIRSSNWTELTTNEGMNLETCGSLRIASILETDETSGKYSSKLMTYDIAYAGPRNRYTVVSDAGPLIVHNCGYGLGWARLQATCRAGALGGPSITLTEREARTGIEMYRSTHPRVVEYWREGDAALAALAGGGSGSWGPLRYERGRIILPNGAPMHYNLQWDDERRSWVRATRTGWRRMWGGSLCLAASAEVLTSDGWKRITDVETSDLLWDSVEWVTHGGVIYNGEKNTGSLNGVRMTEDHEVLSKDKWVRAALAGGLQRAPVRLPSGPERRRDHWQKAFVVAALRLWRDLRNGRSRVCERKASLLRMQDKGAAKQTKNARHEPTSCLLGMEVYARSVPASYAPSLEELRRAGDNRLRAMARELRGVLGGYGADVCGGTYARTNEQQRRLRAKQLQMGNLQGTSEQQTKFEWRAHEARVEKVYDITNCGPRNRFVVRGDDGPFIVHNCENVVQAMARVVMSQAMLRVKTHVGLRPVWTVHDEIVYCLDADGAQQTYDRIERLLKAVPDWLEGCPLDVEGGVGEIYGDVK